MLKGYRKLLQFLKKKIIYIFAGTGDGIDGIVFGGKYFRRLRQIFAETYMEYVAFKIKKSAVKQRLKRLYKQVILYLDTFPRFAKLHKFAASCVERNVGEFLPFSFLFLIVYFCKLLYFEWSIFVAYVWRYSDLIQSLSLRVRFYFFFRKLSATRKAYASNILIRKIPTFLSSRFTKIKRFFFLYRTLLDPAKIDLNLVLFLRPGNSSAYWTGRINWFNILSKKGNYSLILVEFLLMVVVFYFLWYLWVNHFFYCGQQMKFIFAFFCSYFFWDIIRKPELSSTCGIQSYDLTGQPIQYYNFSYLSEQNISGKSFLQMCDSISFPLSIHMNHLLVLVYLLHLMFFFLSFNQLRNMFLLYSQMYLESQFQIPLFAQIRTLSNINPYDPTYYKSFLNHIILRKRVTRRPQRVFFKIRDDVQVTDFFNHPRLFLKYQAGQLMLLKHNRFLFLSSILHIFIFLGCFYYIPLFTCLCLWSMVLFGHWLVLQNLVYADFCYLDQLRPKLKMLTSQMQDTRKFRTLSDLSDIFRIFYKKYIFKRLQTIFLGEHEIDLQYWWLPGNKYVHYLKTRPYFAAAVILLQTIKVFANRLHLKNGISRIVLFIYLFVGRCSLFILAGSTTRWCVRARRNLRRYLGALTIDMVLRQYENFFNQVTKVISAEGLVGLYRTTIKYMIIYFSASILFVVSRCYGLIHTYKNFLLKYRLQRECNLYFPDQQATNKNMTSSQNWTWSTDIIADKSGIFYKILKIHGDKIHGVEVKFLDIEFEKSYYYGNRVFDWSYRTFLDNFPLFESRIFWLEYFVSAKDKQIRQRALHRRKVREAFLISKGLLTARTFTENMIDSILEFQIYWNIKALYIFSKEETETHEVFYGDEPLFEEIYCFKDALGPETFETWDIDNNAIAGFDEEERFQPYYHWVEEMDGSFFKLGQKEFCDFFEFSAEHINELDFERRPEYEPELDETNEDQEEGEAEEKPIPFYLTNQNQGDFSEDDYFEYAGNWIGVGDDFIEDRLAPDDVLDYYGQIKQTVDYWNQFHNIMIAHFLVCFSSIISLLLYYFHRDPKQVFFFFFDISDLFYFDFLSLIFSGSRRSRQSILHIFSPLDYMQFIAPQIDNIFGTGKTNVYGFVVHKMLDQLIEFQIWGNNSVLGKNLAWSDLFTEHSSYNLEKYEVERWRKERYFHKKKFRKKRWFIYNDIARLYLYLYYFSMIKEVALVGLVCVDFFYKFWILGAYAWTNPTVFSYFFFFFYCGYFSSFFNLFFLVFTISYLYIVNKILNEIFKD